MSDREILVLCSAIISRTLRQNLDRFLETGLAPDGSECPLERSIWKNEEWRPVLGLLEKYPKVGLVFFPGRPDRRFMPIPGIKITNRWSELFSESCREAARLFTLTVLHSGTSICKCRYGPCGYCFLLSRPRRYFKHGTFYSPRHRSLASAMVCVADRRSRAQSALIETAAGELLKSLDGGTGWSRDSKRKRDVANT